MKRLTDFRKPVETGVDPRLSYALMTPYSFKTFLEPSQI